MIMDFWQALLVSLLSGGVAGAVVRYFLDVRKARFEYTMKLHREWSSVEYHKMRMAVWAIVEDLTRPEGPGEVATAFLDHATKGTTTDHPAGPAFIHICVFFADLNACLDKSLVDPKFAYRLFGEAQYFGYKPLIDAVRNGRPHDKRGGRRWSVETSELETRFNALRPKSSKWN
jgi:hypothetical protein